MSVVVDTNIIFSAMLNTNSRIAGVLLRPKTTLTFYSTDQLRLEIENHSGKLMALAKYSEYEFKRVLNLFAQRIRFVDRQLIPSHFYQEALSLTKDVDVDDTEFVALTLYLNGRLWSGDRTLRTGLIKKGWNKFVTLNKLVEEQSR